MQCTVKEKLHSLAGLEAALAGNCIKSSDVREQVVEVCLKDFDRKDGSYLGGSGVLLTRDGFLLTAFHVVEPYIGFQKSLLAVMDSRGPEAAQAFLDSVSRDAVIYVGSALYPLDLSLICGSKTIDFALVKAMIPADPVPTGIKFSSAAPTSGERLTACGVVDGILKESPGKVITVGFHNTLPLYIITDASSQRGMSGGAFIDVKGEYNGMLIGGNKLKGGDDCTETSAGPTVQYLQGVLRSVLKQVKERYVTV